MGLAVTVPVTLLGPFRRVVRLLAAIGEKLQKDVAGPGCAYAAGKAYRDRGDFRTALSAFRQAEEQWRATDIGDSTASLIQVAYCRAQLGDLTGSGLDYICPTRTTW